MIRGAIVFLLGVVLGAAVAVGTTVLIAPQPAPTPAPLGDSLDRFGKAFEDAVARALRRIQDEAATRVARVAPDEAESAPPSASKSSRQRRVSADPPAAAPDAGEPMARDPSTPLREKDAGRLQELVVRTKEAETRRRREWLLLSEAAVVKALGMPDDISPNDNGTESWSYELEFTNHDNDVEAARLHLDFSRGRVIGIHGADDIPE